MSLDVYLTREKYLSYDNGKTYHKDNEEVYWRNITHNLTKMADEAGLYYALWRPEEKGFKKAKDLIDILKEGVSLLESDPNRFMKFNPSNGWGNYYNLLDFTKSYLKACLEYPESLINVSR